MLAGDTNSRVLNYFTVQRSKDYHKTVLDLSSGCSSFSAILFRVVTSINFVHVVIKAHYV